MIHPDDLKECERYLAEQEPSEVLALIARNQAQIKRIDALLGPTISQLSIREKLIDLPRDLNAWLDRPTKEIGG